jgi:hypothetical protein
MGKTPSSLVHQESEGGDEYTRMNPAGTLHGQLAVETHHNVGAAAVGTVSEGRACTSSDGGGASAQGQQQVQDPEGRYVLM